MLLSHLRLVLYLAVKTSAYILWTQSVLLLPTLLLTSVLWLTGKAIQWILRLLTYPLSLVAVVPEVRSKTVLISGGGTVQALVLARNLHRYGMRVVVCEVGRGARIVSPARFSVAVARFYHLPQPSECPQSYVRSLCDIVSKEQVSFYLPLCQSTSSYYDALAKPHLERLGCWCFCPGVKEVWMVEGVYEFLDMVSQMGLPIPICFRVTDRQQVMTLFERGAFQQDSYVMIGGGHSNGHKRVWVDLASQELDLMRECLRHKISEQKPWIILQQPEGHQLLTCSSVKDNHVISQVTCRLTTNGLEPTGGEDTLEWVQHFLAHLPLKITGFMTFKFVVPYAGRLRKTLVPLGCQVGVSLPVIWSQHQGAPWRRCQHILRVTNSRPDHPKHIYWLHQEICDLLRSFRLHKVFQILRLVMTSDEAVFAMWDPVPFLVYYHVQAPLHVLRDLIAHACRIRTLKPAKEHTAKLKFLWQEALEKEVEWRRVSNGVT